MVEARQRSPHRHGPSAGATHASYSIGERRMVHCSPSALLKNFDTAADVAGPALEELVLGVPLSAWRVVCLAAILVAVSPPSTSSAVPASLNGVPIRW